MTRSRTFWSVLAAVGMSLAIALTLHGVASARTLPVFEIDKQGLSKQDRRTVSRSLGLRSGVKVRNGVVQFLSASRFLAVPTRPGPRPAAARDEDGRPLISEAFDLPGIQALKTPNRKASARKLLRALRKAGELPAGARAALGGSTFEIFDNAGKLMTRKQVDARIEIRQRLNGLPLTGPGADIGASFDPAGRITQLNIASRDLDKGKRATVQSSQAVASQVRYRVAPCGKPPAQRSLKRRLVYYSPELKSGKSKPDAIHPQYEVGGTIGSGEGAYEMRTQLVPATDSAPNVVVQASGQGSRITARTLVRGGNAPYTISWASCSTALPPGLGRSSITYDVSGMSATPVTERLLATVTDADGQTTVASADVRNVLPTPKPKPQPAAAPAPRPRASVSNKQDVGAMYLSQNANPTLKNTAANASGFINRMFQLGIPYDPQVWRGDFGLIEFMFRDQALLPDGSDHAYADNVDMLFFTGHAFSLGFQVGPLSLPYGGPPSNYDGWQAWYESRYGNNDLEWLVIAGCGPLQETGGGKTVGQRWLPAMHGLHMLLGYASKSRDVSGEGYRFADNMIRRNMLIRDAWVDAAMANQPWESVWAFMGPMGPGNTHNYNDRFKGTATPDIPRAAHTGYYVYRGNS